MRLLLLGVFLLSFVDTYAGSEKGLAAIVETHYPDMRAVLLAMGPANAAYLNEEGSYDRNRESAEIWLRYDDFCRVTLRMDCAVHVVLSDSGLVRRLIIATYPHLNLDKLIDPIQISAGFGEPNSVLMYQMVGELDATEQTIEDCHRKDGGVVLWRYDRLEFFFLRGADNRLRLFNAVAYVGDTLPERAPCK